ncbi:MAG TPA: transcriptional repressor [Polyangiaceae bacterium LLY-WYZ-14_1]|nr:transcriptional repressor [Polyangiaceae bacterium LLY-WYZ-14_1]
MAKRGAGEPERDEILAGLRDRLRAAGLRATPARVAVYGALRAAARPVSHADVCAALDGRGFDRATVYRNLVDLTDAGLARRADHGDRVWRFEGIRKGKGARKGAAPGEADGDRLAHPHFVCSECGTVTCLPEDAVQVGGAPTLPRAVRQAQASLDIQIRGTCDDCV